MLSRLFGRRTPEFGHGDPVWYINTYYQGSNPQRRVIHDVTSDGYVLVDSGYVREYVSFHEAKKKLRLRTDGYDFDRQVDASPQG